MKILEILTEKRDIGTRGEREAARLLRKAGYKILKKNYVAVGYEIDIIARNKDTVIFVEVKSRTLGHESPKEARPASAVTPEKQRKIISAAKYFMGETHEEGRMRFDIIEVYFNENKKAERALHMEGAFNYDTAHPKRF